MLFAARDHQAWAGARVAAMEAVVRGPAMAVAVLALETQRLGVAAMQVTESAARDGFSARASVERDGTGLSACLARWASWVLGPAGVGTGPGWCCRGSGSG